MPGEKWRANQHPHDDWRNTCELAQTLATTTADHAILISTVDVYETPNKVDETSPVGWNQPQAYGAHRAWFEAFFRSHYPSVTILRLPGLFAPDVRKNLIHDLLHNRRDYWVQVNPESRFQFFDTTQTWRITHQAMDAGIPTLNVAVEPVTAQQVADIFGATLHGTNPPVQYDMRTQHDNALGGANGYLFNADTVLQQIAALREGQPE